MPIVRVKVSDRIHKMLKDECEEVGVTMSSLCANLIGNYLRQKRDVQPKVIDELVKRAFETAKEDIEKDELTLFQAFLNSNKRREEG